MMIFNQFAEMGNPLWHYNVTGYALAELFEAVKKPGQNFAGACFTSGSAGTMSAGDLLKERYPHLKLAVGEALQCPTILDNGFGGHRIEGIGDKHIPWIHNVKNTDMVIDIDVTATAGIKSFWVTIDSEALKDLLPVINMPEKFDICDIPADLAAILHDEFGFPINEQVKNQTAVMFSITKFVEILLEIPGEHNFVLDVTDNNNVLTHKTVKLIVKAAE